MMWTNKRVFISGGNGVIGRELVNRLHSLGADIMVGDLKAFGGDLPRDIRYRQGDLNYCKPDELLSFKPEFFFHLAATFERSVETYDFWEENFWHNIRLSHHLMTILKDCPTLKRVVFASSYLIYDQGLYQFSQAQHKAYRLQEQDAICPRNLTGMAKLMHEMELNFLEEFSSERLSVVMPRIYRVYGKGSRDVISRWARQLLAGEKINVYRKEGMFDYIYAGDVAEGLVRLAATDFRGVVNLGKDHARRVEEVVEVFRANFPGMQAGEYPSDISFEASQADMDVFKQVTGWKPKIEIEAGIPMVIDYEKRQQVRSEIASEANVLVTSASKKIPLLQTVKQAMAKLGGKGRLIAADSNDTCLASYFADEFWQMPALADLNDDTLLTELKRRGVRYIVPTRDGELLFWSERKAWLRQAGIGVMVSDPGAVQACVDKLDFYRQCRQLNIPAIETSLKLEELTAEHFVVKDRYGAGARRMGIGLTEEQARQHGGSLEDPVFQPLVSGVEYSVDAYVDRYGQVKGVVCRTRDIVMNGESQVTTTVNDPELEQLCRDYIERLGVFGHVVLQLIVDSGRQPWIIECNARFGGASTLSVAAGLDSFYWFFLEMQGQDLADYQFLKASQRLRQVRYPADCIEQVSQ
jgi:carbamoyl-phosphate synthase large subunit